MMRFTTFIIGIWVALTSVAQISFKAQAPTTVQEGEEFYLKYVLQNADGDGFSNPSFADFDLLAGPSVSNYSYKQIVNGQSSSSKSVTYTYVLRARKKGSYQIPAATVRVGGKVYKSQSLTLQVKDSGASAKSQGKQRIRNYDDDDDMAVDNRPQQVGAAVGQRDLFCTTHLSRREVYEQEPIVVTYKAHARVGVHLTETAPAERQDFKDFWSQEIEATGHVQKASETVGGVHYAVVPCQQYILFPQRSGALTVPGAKMFCYVLQYDRSLDAIDAYFNGAGYQNLRLPRQSEDVSITVLPLPTPRPAAFSGGVGHFTLNTELVTPIPKTNDIATLRVKVAGSGNMKLIKAPTLVFPDDFDTYDAKMSDNTKVTLDGITGEVCFDYTFVPRNVGQYTIPAADFVYFDTQRREYVTLHTDPIKLDVAKGKRSKEDVEAELAMRNSDIRDIHSNGTDVHDTDSILWVGSIGYIAFMAVLTLSLSLLLRFLRHRHAMGADVAGRRNRKARKMADKHLQAAQKALNGQDSNAFYAALAQALRGYFADKLSRDAAALTNDAILSALAERGVSEELQHQTSQLLSDCDFARFAPAADPSQCTQDFERATQLINTIDSKL